MKLTNRKGTTAAVLVAAAAMVAVLATAFIPNVLASVQRTTSDSTTCYTVNPYTACITSSGSTTTGCINIPLGAVTCRTHTHKSATSTVNSTTTSTETSTTTFTTTASSSTTTSPLPQRCSTDLWDGYYTVNGTTITFNDYPQAQADALVDANGHAPAAAWCSGPLDW